MTFNPLSQACLHVATAAEQQRDPAFLACNAQPGRPCTWARRYDGQPNPPFHSERLEAALTPSAIQPSAADSEAFRNAVLQTGLV